MDYYDDEYHHDLKMMDDFCDLFTDFAGHGNICMVN